MSELFLAEAAVAVIPDLTAFRARLIRDLETATAGVVANVKVAATGATAAAAAATRATGPAQQTVGLANQNAIRSEAALEEVRRRSAAALRVVEQSERAASLASARTVEARTRLAAATRDVAIREEAFLAARRSGNQATINAAQISLNLARGREREAIATFEAARSERVLAAERAKTAATSAFAARGFASQALAAAGLRGAVLSANAAFLAGTVAAVGFFKAVQSAASFETNLNVFAVQAGATADQMERVSATARQLGADLTLPGVNAGDAAETLNELSRAGLSVEDAIGGTRGVLQLATAAAISNAEATSLAASALNAFGLAGTEATHVADVFTNAANASQGSITDVGLSLQQAAAVARQVGVSFEDTTALLTLLARNGIRGSDAGTSLRVAFTKLINPTQKARDVLESLNIQLRDAQGNIRPEVFAEFGEAQRGLSRAQQDTNAGIVFGTDALRAYSIASREGISGLNAIRGELAKQGSAAELAEARVSGLAGAAENLANQLSTLGLSLGNMAKGPLKDFVDILAGGFANINAGIEFLGNLGDRANETGLSFEEITEKLAEFNKEGGASGALKTAEFLERITSEAGKASIAYTNLIEEAGRVNRAVAERGDKAGTGLLAEQLKLNKALEETQPAALKAKSAIEDYRFELQNAATTAEGLRNRLDEAFDRTAPSPNLEPVVPRGPRPIGPSARLEGDLALAQASGDDNSILAIQRKALARAKKAFEESRGNVNQRTELFNAMRAAEAAVIATEKRISDQVAQDRKQAASEAERRAAEADRDAISGVSRREGATFGAREIAVQQTKRLTDDIKLARDRKKFLLRQIEVARTSIQDDELRADTIRELRNRRRKLTAEIDTLLQQQREAAATKAQERRDALTERLDLALQIAQSRGKKDQILEAINALIANARKNVAAAKKGSLAQLREKAALEGLIAQRRDIIKGAVDEAKKGTTAFDLLQQFAGRFGEIGGNLINGDQPFAGPTGFTADIAQFLRRQAGGGAAAATAPGARGTKKSPLEINDDRLVRSIDRLADVIIESGGGSGRGANGGLPQRAVDALGARMNEAARFYQERAAKAAVEAGA